MNERSVVLQCETLSKAYRRAVALRDLSLRIYEGEVFGLVGPNGSGKTTLFRLLCGLVKPTSGRMWMFGEQVPLPAEKAAQVGVMIEEPAFYPWMDAAENLQVYALALGRRVERAAIGATLEMVGLGSVGKKKVRAFSQGMRQRLGIARALLLKPRLLILDEPTNGLDPDGIVWLRNLVKALQEEGRTILLASHLVGEIEKVCSRVGFMAQGKLTQIVDLAGGEVDLEKAALETVGQHARLQS